jgi:hypothetical protein
VSPGYFATMAMTMIAGREFDDRDTRNTPKVAVVSAALAQRLWPGRDPIGRTLTLINTWSRNDEKNEWYSVIGVVNDVSPILHDAAARAYMYLPLGQEWRPGSYHVLVRAVGDSRTLIPAVKDLVARADSFADVSRLTTMSQMAAQILYPRRIAGAILAGSAVIALLLAALGVYGVVSYSVAQRTGEIGVRMALGASRADITRLILREGVFVASFGSLAGLALGWTAIRLTSSNFLALPQVDLWSLLITPLVLGASVLLACYFPARRAGYLDPMDVLRRS